MESQLQSMINTGQLGYSQPNVYNPYNNIIPIGQTNYNQQQNQYVFRPAMNMNQFGNPYAMNNMCQPNNQYIPNNNAYNYYNPYGAQQNNYAYGYYGGVTPTAYQRMLQEQYSLAKLKYKISGACVGREYTEEQLEYLTNPAARARSMTKEEIEYKREEQQIIQFRNLFAAPQMEQTNAMRASVAIRAMSENFHKEFDDVSLMEFLDDGAGKLLREEWLSKNIKNEGRDLSRTYSSSDYNDLLNLHRSSNPYLNDILDTSRYDNNLDDLEIGLPSIMEMQRRRQQLIEGNVPQYVSTDENQKRRHEFNEQILQQIYSKGVKP